MRAKKIEGNITDVSARNKSMLLMMMVMLPCNEQKLSWVESAGVRTVNLFQNLTTSVSNALIQ